MSNSAFPGCSQRNISLIMASVQPYILYTYIFLTVVIEECDGPRAFVLRWGGAEEANQHDHGHLRTRRPQSLSKAAAGRLTLRSSQPPISAFTTINVPWFCKLVYVSLSYRCGHEPLITKSKLFLPVINYYCLMRNQIMVCYI